MKIKPFLKRNSPLILSIIAGIGVVAVEVITAIQAPKAKKAIEKAEEEKGTALTKSEKVKTAAPFYILPTALAGGTIFAIFASNYISRKQQASLVAAYALLNRSYQSLKDRLSEEYTEDFVENLEKDIREEVTSDAFSNEKITWYFEGYGLFEATKQEVYDAEATFHMNYNYDGVVSLHDFLYDMLGQDHDEIVKKFPESQNIVWMWSDTEETIFVEFTHVPRTLDDGMAVLEIVPSFIPMPMDDYDKLMR